MIIMTKSFVIYLHRIAHFLIVYCLFANVFTAGRQSDIIQVNSSHSTNCIEGLIALIDRIIFTGEILLDEFKNVTVIYFDFKSQGDSSSFITECFLHYPFCSDTGTKCYCTMSMLTNKLTYVVNLTADVELSKGIFKTYFVNANSLVSSEKEIPLIVDSSTVGKTVVNINNITANENCALEFDHGKLTVEAVCNSSLKPCNLKLSSDKEELEKESFILFRREYSEPTSIKLTIEQSICNSTISSTVLNCTIALNNRKVTEQTNFNNRKVTEQTNFDKRKVTEQTNFNKRKVTELTNFNLIVSYLVPGVVIALLLIIAVYVCHRLRIFELCWLYVKQKALEKEVSELDHLIEVMLPEKESTEKNSAEDSKMFQNDLHSRHQKAKNDSESLNAKLDQIYAREMCSCFKSILLDMMKKQDTIKKSLSLQEASLKIADTIKKSLSLQEASLKIASTTV